MARDVNKVTILGRLGGSPELRHTASGQPVANMSVATNNRYTNAAGEKIDDVAWHRIVLWGKVADVAAKYLHTGSRVYLEGRLSYRKWTDKEGVDRSTTEIVVDELVLLDQVAASEAPRSNGSAVAAGEPPF